MSFAWERGGVHALLGGNGSGKSTLIKCLAGVYQADPGGEVRLGGTRIDADRITPSWARTHGLRFVHQHVTAFSDMTVEENLALGHGYPVTGPLIRWRALRSRTQSLLDRFGIEAKPDQEMSTVRPADQAMIAVARALQDRYLDDVGEISTVILDEPTASMPEEEVGILLNAIKACASDGLAVVFVTHRLEEVTAIADTVTVLRDGVLATSEPAEGLEQSDLVGMMLGADIEELVKHKKPASAGRVVASFDDVSVDVLKSVSLEVREGEVLGLAGLVGSGRTEALRVLFGDLKPESGSVTVDGEEAELASPHDAMSRGIAYVPEDRANAIFANLSVRENLIAPSIRSFTKGPFLDRRREVESLEAAVDRFKIKIADGETPISTLSGGNQQKVVLARWLERDPLVLLLDEPTQGVDVVARADAFDFIRAATDRGVAVVVVSSDFEELADLSDRVLILAAGTVIGEVTGNEVTRRELSRRVLMGAGV